jgi:hypothetical protein
MGRSCRPFELREHLRADVTVSWRRFGTHVRKEAEVHRGSSWNCEDELHARRDRALYLHTDTEALAATSRPDARQFDVIVIGGGSFGPTLAENVFVMTLSRSNCSRAH